MITKSNTILNASIVLILASALLVIISCGSQGDSRDSPSRDRTEDQIDLDQTITVTAKPKDSLFANFSKFWPTMVSTVPELMLPVRIPDDPDDVPESDPWNPRVSSNCVFSEDAGMVVPEVTLSWAEPLRNVRKQPMRGDLTIHYQGFQRDLYTSLFPITAQTRFVIPGNSEFVRDTAAVLLSGFSLFPKVGNFAVNTQTGTSLTPGTSEQIAQSTDAGVTYELYSITFRDLSPGLSYTIRLCAFEGEIWQEEKRFVFNTPICKNKF